MSAGFASKKTNYQSEIAASVLLDCKTVVEKDDFVSTGVLTYAEGDIVEVEIAEYKLFKLGSPVKLTIYSPAGIHVFHSTVIARHNGAIMVINPPENKRKFRDKRESPRVPADRKGHFKSPHESTLFSKGEPVALQLKNVSLSGMGLTVFDYDRLPAGTRLDLTLDIGFTLECPVEVVRCEPLQQGFYYGVQLLDLTPEQSQGLRAFILRSQAETYFKTKEVERDKREE
ncbi:PilZ domain-containing protein [Paenibacillus gansuensis]|uniref:PilZ domain-containing protein n=1 Tax=Paenibacillus gansuensis TaxID=306542 RepID=A0ABW5PLC2_9BACL